MYEWDQLEELVCGAIEINVDYLEANTVYSGCTRKDTHVNLFWEALRDFSNFEKSSFLKFVWGSSRLPLTSASFTQKFRIERFRSRIDVQDQYLPVSHTCFFSLELPYYSTLDVMKERLRYAIFNCEAIDVDNTDIGILSARMGWEE